MERVRLEGTDVFVRNFGIGRSRIVIIEPKVMVGYEPVRIQGCSVILWNGTMRSELSKFYTRVDSRPRRNEVFPGGISSKADIGLKLYAMGK